MEHWIYTLLQSSVTNYFRVRTMIWQSSFKDFMSYYCRLIENDLFYDRASSYAIQYLGPD